MIRQFLERLPKEALERVATDEMRPGSYTPTKDGQGPCLVGVTEGFTQSEAVSKKHREPFTYSSSVFRNDSVEARYDALCIRLGTARANDLIRAVALAILMSKQPVVVPTESKQLVHA